jgi:glycosyltransferase involved in cell wall biosynthesis
MDASMQAILRKKSRNENEPLNIVTFLTHGRYESILCKTGQEFYSTRLNEYIQWDDKCVPRPANYHLLPIKDNEINIPRHIPVDLVLCQAPNQRLIAKHIAQIHHIPVVSITHTMGNGSHEKEMIEDVNVFITEEQRYSYGFDKNFGEVIHNCPDCDLFIPKENVQKDGYAITVVNQFINRQECGFELWKSIIFGFETKNILPYKVLGTTPGLSESASSVDELVFAYQNASLYLNVASNYLPLTVLEAMACGTPVVTTPSGIVNRAIIEHGKNGLIAKTSEELRKYSELLISDKELSCKMGKEAHSTIMKNFHHDTFVKRWNEVFWKTAKIRRF